MSNRDVTNYSPPSSVMWSETVGLRTRPVSDQKSVLVLQVWSCVVKHDLVTLVVIMILKDTATFQVLFRVSLFCAWNITTVEINSGVCLLKSLIRQVPLFTSGGLGLGLGRVILVLFLRIRSCLHHWPFRRKSRTETWNLHVIFSWRT